MSASIAIVGAGPSGLLFARFLHLASIKYTIFERDESQTWAAGRSGSGTLDLRKDSGQLAIEKAGLMDAFKQRARYIVPSRFVAATGKVIVTLGEGEETEQPEIDRKDLRDMLLASIPRENVQWNRKLQTVSRTAEGTFELKFQDGVTETGFDLLVGADGAWSKVRKLVTSAIPQYSGYHFLTTNVYPEDKAYATAQRMNPNGNNLVFGNEMMGTLMTLGNGSYHIGTGLRLPEDWRVTHSAILDNNKAMGSWLRKNHLADWSQERQEIFGHGGRPWHLWPVYAMPTSAMNWKSVPGVALLGDAAHLTPPFSGGGVNSALHDSYQFAQQILKHGVGNFDGAIEEYETEMFPRAIKHLNKAWSMRELLFAPDAPAGFMKFFGVDTTAPQA